MQRRQPVRFGHLFDPQDLRDLRQEVDELMSRTP
jgi:hypothetical protein